MFYGRAITIQLIFVEFQIYFDKNLNTYKYLLKFKISPETLF